MTAVVPEVGDGTEQASRLFVFYCEQTQCNTVSVT